jgi:hypothetical protein
VLAPGGRSTQFRPPENDNRVTVCLPLGARGSSWNLWPIYEEILKDEPTLAAIERTATTTAHELSRHRRPVSFSAHQRVSGAAVRAGKRLGLWGCKGFYVGHRTGGKLGPAFGKLVDDRFRRTDQVRRLGKLKAPARRSEYLTIPAGPHP